MSLTRPRPTLSPIRLLRALRRFRIEVLSSTGKVMLDTSVGDAITHAKANGRKKVTIIVSNYGFKARLK